MRSLGKFNTLLTIVSLALGTPLDTIYCNNGNVTDLWIKGCDSQPCTIRKGELLPFDMQVVFDQPTVPAEMNFRAFIPNYGPPSGPPRGSTLSKGNCKEGLRFKCPLNAGTVYTVKSELYIDPKAKCNGKGCEDMSENGTGPSRSLWDWNVYAPGDDKQNSSYCSFAVDLNIIA